MSTFDNADPFRSQRSSTVKPVVVSLLLAASAAGVLYYAYQLWQSKRTAEVQLDAVRTEVKRLNRDREKTREKVQLMEQAQAERTEALQSAQGQVQALSAKLAAAESKLDELAEARAETEERLAEFKRFTKSFQRMIDSGKLEVNFRRGRMIVELPARVLFPSASAELTEDGQKSLREVAKILRQIRGKRFIVAGHTDNVGISTPEFPSNWELSTRRAVNVTRMLIRGGMHPRRLVAAGFGPYDPVASNRSKWGRKRNRRIEIILEPQLRELPNLADAK